MTSPHEVRTDPAAPAVEIDAPTQASPALDEPAEESETDAPVVAVTGRPLAQLVLVAGLAGLLAAVLAWTGVAAPWAVVVGCAAGLGTAATPALPRGLVLLTGGLAGWGAAALRDAAAVGEVPVVTGLVIGGLVLAAGLVTYLSRARIAAWPAVLGAGAMLVGTDQGGIPALADVMAVLAGLAAGVVAVVAAEAVTAWRRRPREAVDGPAPASSPAREGPPAPAGHPPADGTDPDGQHGVEDHGTDAGHGTGEEQR